MGLFNTIQIEMPCPAGGERDTFAIQFKYGETYQHEYELGQRIRWGHPKLNQGVPGYRKVQVDACGGDCRHCQVEFFNCAVVLEYGQIVSVEPIHEDPSPLEAKGFIVIEP